MLRPSGRIGAYFYSLCVLVGGMLLTFLAFNVTRDQDKRALKIEFDHVANEYIERIETRLKAYHQILSGVRGLFAGSEEVDRKEFYHYISGLGLKDQYPGIQGIGYSVHIPPSQLEDHLSKIRRTFPLYAIRPNTPREIYTSIIYIEPFDERNQRAFGFDMFSEPIRRQAMELSRDQNTAVISGKVRLVQETERDIQSGFLMYLPFYKNETDGDTKASKSKNFAGWVYAPFRMDDFMKGLGGVSEKDIDIEIYDGEELSDSTRMFDADHVPIGDQSKNSYLKSIRRMDLFKRSWTIAINALPSFNERSEKKYARYILVSGIILSFTSSLLAWFILSGRARALKLAGELSREFKLSQEKLQLLLDSTGDAVYGIDLEGCCTFCNPACLRILGYQSTSDILGKNMHRLIHHSRQDDSHYPDDECPIFNAFQKGVSCRISDEVFWKADGSSFPVEYSSYPQLVAGRPVGAVIVFVDITERKKAEDRIRHMAQYDPLTDLPNRALFSDRLRQALAAAARTNGKLALLYLDLDKFKPINDRYGHAVGDLVLKEAANRMLASVRKSDTVARIGGDEFVIMLPSTTSEEQAFLVAEKIRNTLNDPIFSGNLALSISSSIGIALYPDHGSSELEISNQADQAMYRAKKSGRNRVVMANSST